MRKLRPEHISALFSEIERGLTPGRSIAPYATGNIYCLNRNLECVPFVVGGLRFILEISTPYYITQVEPYETILLRTTTGSVFIPKLDHRYLNLVSFASDQQLVDLCQTPAASLPQDLTALSNAIRDALIAYYRSYPNANQYFYMVDVNAKQMLHETFNNIPPDLLARYQFAYYADLADPYAGFSLTSKAL